MKRYVLICALLAACGSADEATMMMGGAGGTGGASTTNAGGTTSATKGHGGAQAMPTMDPTYVTEDWENCQPGNKQLHMNIIKTETPTCVRSSAGHRFKLFQGVCNPEMVFASLSPGGIPPKKRSEAILSQGGEVIEPNGTTCNGGPMGALGSCTVQLAQSPTYMGMDTALFVCAADANGDVYLCTQFPPCS